MKTQFLRLLSCLFVAADLHGATVSISKDFSFTIGAPSTRAPGQFGDSISEIIEARDGGRVVIGSENGPYGRPVVSKLSKQGSVEWSRAVGETNVFHFFADAIQATNNDIIVLEYVSSYDFLPLSFASPVVRVLGQGSDVSHEIGTPLHFQRLAQVGDGYLLAGKYPAAGWRFFVRRVSFAFETIWEKLTPTGQITGRTDSDRELNVIDLQPTRDRGVVCLLDSGHVVKVAADGANEWVAGFSAGDSHHPRKVVALRDGGYLVVYDSSWVSAPWRTAPAYGDDDYWIVRLNDAGAKIWDRSFGGNRKEALSFVSQTDDGGLILGGASDSDTISGNKGVTGRGTWLLKLTSAGVKETEHLLADDYPGMLPKGTGFELFGWDASASLVSVPINAKLRSIVTARSVGGLSFNIDASTDLTTWTPRVMGFSGELRLTEDPTEPQKFYRVWDVVE